MVSKKGFYLSLLCVSTFVLSICLLFSSGWANGEESHGGGHDGAEILSITSLIGGMGSGMSGGMSELMDDHEDGYYDFEGRSGDWLTLLGLSALGAGYGSPLTYGQGYPYSTVAYPTTSVIPSGWNTYGYSSLRPSVYPATTYYTPTYSSATYRPTYPTYTTTAGTYGWTSPLTAYTPSATWTIPTQASYTGLTSGWSGLAGLPTYGYTGATVAYPSYNYGTTSYYFPSTTSTISYPRYTYY